MNLLTLVSTLCLGLNLYNVFWDIKNKRYSHLPLSVGLSALMIYFLIR